MHFSEIVRRRRMVRAFRPSPIAADVLDRILEAARRGPSAGNSQGMDLVVLEGSAQTERYWATTLSPGERDQFPWPGLLDAPVIVLVVVAPHVYVERYAEDDKVRTGLGDDASAWPVPYWFVDGGAAAMALLYGATAEGLGALFFGLFDHEGAMRDHLAIPDDRRIIGAVALGHGIEDRPSGSARRPRRPRADVIHRGRW